MSHPGSSPPTGPPAGSTRHTGPKHLPNTRNPDTSGRKETESFGKFRRETERFATALKSVSTWPLRQFPFHATFRVSCSTVPPSLCHPRPASQACGGGGRERNPPARNGTERNETESSGKKRNVSQQPRKPQILGRQCISLEMRVPQLACQAVFGPHPEQHGLRANRATPEIPNPQLPLVRPRLFTCQRFRGAHVRPASLPLPRPEGFARANVLP
jgi:hypothetical protein